MKNQKQKMKMIIKIKVLNYNKGEKYGFRKIKGSKSQT